jgi:hypothetical protein
VGCSGSSRWSASGPVADGGLCATPELERGHARMVACRRTQSRFWTIICVWDRQECVLPLSHPHCTPMVCGVPNTKDEALICTLLGSSVSQRSCRQLDRPCAALLTCGRPVYCSASQQLRCTAHICVQVLTAAGSWVQCVNKGDCLHWHATSDMRGWFVWPATPFFDRAQFMCVDIPVSGSAGPGSCVCQVQDPLAS